jgi:hypothetical protein
VCTTRVLKLTTSPFFSPARASTKIDPPLTKAPTTGADSDKIDDLVAMARSQLLHHLYDVMMHLVWVKGLSQFGNLSSRLIISG